MSRAEHLFPTGVPQCEATRAGNYANDTPDTNRRCQKQARYRVAGKCFCLRHAEIAALDVLLKEKKS